MYNFWHPLAFAERLILESSRADLVIDALFHSATSTLKPPPHVSRCRAICYKSAVLIQLQKSQLKSKLWVSAREYNITCTVELDDAFYDERVYWFHTVFCCCLIWQPFSGKLHGLFLLINMSRVGATDFFSYRDTSSSLFKFYFLSCRSLQSFSFENFMVASLLADVPAAHLKYPTSNFFPIPLVRESSLAMTCGRPASFQLVPRPVDQWRDLPRRH